MAQTISSVAILLKARAKFRPQDNKDVSSEEGGLVLGLLTEAI